MDRHQIWRRVRYDWEQANERRPSGHFPIVLAWVAGRPEPVELGFVETRRGNEEVWIRFETSAPEVAAGSAIPPQCSWIHVHESALLSVEVSYRRSSHAIGFSYSESDDDTPRELAA